MNKQSIIERLLALPKEIAAAEEAVISANKAVQDAKNALQGHEYVLLTSGAIDGKNAEIRSAQLRSFTSEQHEAVTQAEYNLVRIKNHLALLYNEFRALQTVADLLKGAA
ncbi:hypothetical protein ACFSTH_08150 [Paenibacillus yanchengensis]|uniref:Uncharacterized protein n=1 Tax=Paenibacillus yanchengensis TaxID=2035833 RepID=A0ABW4YL33_9BACL